jgi:pyruvate/2-oxoacid:ferredoxin oxidoreductase alpha subunit
MKITKTRLKEIIKEEVQKILEAKHKDEEVTGVKVVEEEEELDEMSTMAGAAVEGAPAKEQ